MNAIQTLINTLADPALSDAAACAPFDQLAAAFDAVMRGPSSLADKIIATRVAYDLGWGGVIPAYFPIISAEAAVP